jgi:hypothetical protein
MHFLFPSDPLNPRQVDEAFLPQVEAFRALGHGTSLFSMETEQLRGPIPEGSKVVYRGWMLNASEYEKMIDRIRARGAEPLIPLETYLSCHHLPNWYPLISDLTPETRIFPADTDLASELAALGWDRFFLKDYVKSLKTSVGSAISRPEEADSFIAEMKKFRGEIEGGFCVRRFEPFQAGTEVRYFVIEGTPHAPSGAVPDLVTDCSRRIASPFFSVDVTIREDGALRVVEIGDGQVSDLVGWEVERFAGLWASV